MKAAPLRWTLGVAASEFGLDRRTMAERVKASGAAPGEDGRFSSRQIATALYGDLAGEKLRKVRAEADLAEMEVLEKRKTSIPTAIFFPVLEQCFGAISAVIKRAPLIEAQRQEILSELRGVPATLWGQGFNSENLEAPK